MLTRDELTDFLQRALPVVDHRGEIIDGISADSLCMRLPSRPDYLGPELPAGSGRVVMSGPVMMGFADTALYACIHAFYGTAVAAVIVNFQVIFLSVAGGGDLRAVARIVRKGRTLAFVEAHLFSGDANSPCAQVTATYAIRPNPGPLGQD